MHTLSIKDTLLTTYDFKMKFQYYLGIIRALQSLIYYCFVVNWINYKQYCVGLYIYILNLEMLLVRLHEMNTSDLKDGYYYYYRCS